VTQTDAKAAVLLAKKYRVLGWLKTSYGRLIQQSPLTIEELSSHPALDWETIARLFYLKQNNLTGQNYYSSSIYCTTCGDYFSGQICTACHGTDLERVFRTEFESVSFP